MMKEVYDQARAYVEQRKDKLTEDLCTLVRVPSVRGEAEPGAPYGRECARMLEVIRDLFASHGIEAKIWAESGYLIAEVGQGERCFGLFAHSDVVAVDNNWTLCAPFAAEVRDGFVIGRGSGDNKSGVIASLYAAMAIRDLDIPFGSRIWLVVGSCEETGMTDMDRFVEEQTLPDVSLVPDMMYPVGRGQKSKLRFWAVSREKLTAVRDFSGGTTPNVVLGEARSRFAYRPELEKALTGLGEAFTCERQGDELVLTARGVAAHDGWPERSVNAARLLAEALSGCPELPENDRDLLARVSGLLEGYRGEGLDAAHSDPDFGYLTCTNGMVRLRDGRLALNFGARYGTSLDSGELIDRLARRLDETGFDMDVVERADGFVVPEDDPHLRALLDCYAEITGTDSPRATLANAGTYARKLKGTAFDTGPRVLYPNPFRLPAGHGGAHQADECTPINGVVDGAARLAAMLVSLDRMERK